MFFPEKLDKKLQDREERNAFRTLPVASGGADFYSNDYLGLSGDASLFYGAADLVEQCGQPRNGATGSRLLSGNHSWYGRAERKLAGFHQAEAALVFNSGYDANVGLFSSVLQRGDVVLYDELIHASIRDGIRMGQGKGFRFRHNDIADLESHLRRIREKEGQQATGHLYIVTESVFSMDGDIPDLEMMTEVAEKYGAFLIVDEAHAVGVFGNGGEGMVQALGLQDRVFARIVTFGKAVGCHGAAVLGPARLKDYLVNFARSLIYTTAMPPHALAAVMVAYDKLATPVRAELLYNIGFFRKQLETFRLLPRFIESRSAIHCCVIPGNDKVKLVSQVLGEQGFSVKPILSPTVPEGQERLRFCLHSYNTEKEISAVLHLLSGWYEKWSI
ncbi:aminotransferase class I/II-fold pyridoxal phosphate-dependent enzyme [Sinomicrobium soli]|uniref:aminotransferase class I/II-fold pyridoxal phosphate-dependent enzyme n=1 Tax=Sinomicrobium sp. N-1-3-6 TaxID=2219864 RepID=UPI000DCB6417|nr:8-amino-7-oxononanoate synthase [Sinomicrobium sp. N-1-3-6]RAV29609.1 8-amino-7-oxononanoate synthase [Sinomicrobium sp. N-1-3-6]